MNTFDNQSVQRIGDAVRRVESMAMLAVHRRRRDYGGTKRSRFTFTVSKVGSVVSMTAGSIRTSTQNYSVAADDVTLTGVTEWVYVYHERDHTGSGFSHSSAEPLSTGSRWVWPLAYYTASAGVYTLQTLHHQGDVFLYEAMS